MLLWTLDQSRTDYIQLYDGTQRFCRGAEFDFSVQCLHDEFSALI